MAFFSFNLLFNSTGLTLLTRLTKYLFFADAFVLAYFANAHKNFKSKILKTKLPILVLTLIVGGLGINRFINQCNRYPELMFPYISVFSDSKRNETPVDFDFSMLLE